MSDDFAALILTHGRPNRVHTFEALRERGYSGRIFLVVDDEDEALDQYRDRFGSDQVLVFSKAAIAETFDEADNFGDRRAIVYARNASFELARSVGAKHFVQLDDDYVDFYYRFGRSRRYGTYQLRSLDALFSMLVDFLRETPFLSVAISQGGDHIGGGQSKPHIGSSRKAMNTFVCSVDRPFSFLGRINEDVNTYTSLQRRGGAFLTFLAAQVNQKQTQTNEGGMTELYLDSGTYVKSFYSVMFSPSSVQIALLRGNRRRANERGLTPGRIHHRIRCERTAPMILRESVKKGPRRSPESVE